MNSNRLSFESVSKVEASINRINTAQSTLQLFSDNWKILQKEKELYLAGYLLKIADCFTT